MKTLDLEKLIIIHDGINEIPTKEIIDLMKKVIPDGYTIIRFNHEYNQPLNWIPDGIIQIEFEEDSEFNLPLVDLPNSITKIIFLHHTNFNQPLNHLPPNLQVFMLNDSDNSFDQSLDYLPSNLVELAINTDTLTHSLDNLPMQLKFFKLHAYTYTQSLVNLPNSLLFMDLGFTFQNYLQNPITHLPTNLEMLDLWINTLGIRHTSAEPLELDEMDHVEGEEYQAYQDYTMQTLINHPIFQSVLALQMINGFTLNIYFDDLQTTFSHHIIIKGSKKLTIFQYRIEILEHDGHECEASEACGHDGDNEPPAKRIKLD